MNIHQQKHRLDVRGSDLSGSLFDDVNLSGAVISDGRYDGMTIDGVDVVEMLRVYRTHAGRGAS
jgi:uncharacterized protein YjbI with pentapeptide repeats